MIIGIVAAASAGLLGLLCFLRLRQKPRCPYIARPLSDAQFDAMAAGSGWRTQKLGVAPGVELRGLLREPATPAGPWILYFGGNSTSVLGESRQVLAALCAGQGWGCVVWAYRGFDSSGGVPQPTALEEDGFKAWSELLARPGVRPDAVHLVGYSIGTSIAAAVAARARPTPPASLTLLAAMTTLYVGQRTQLFLHRYETLKWLKRVASPALVIHGMRDQTLAVEGGRTVAKTLGRLASLLELPEVGHTDLPMSPAAQGAMRAFIDRHASGKQPSTGPAGPGQSHDPAPTARGHDASG